MMDDGEAVVAEKEKNKFNAVKQLIYMQLDSFLNQQQLREKMETILQQIVVDCNDVWANALTVTIFSKLVDALNLSINKYYHQSLSQLKTLTHIVQQDFAYDIAGIALAKTLKCFKEEEKLEDRLLERFINYLAIASVGNLISTLNDYWKEYVLIVEDEDGKKGRPRFELFEENINDAGATGIVNAREIIRRIIEKYAQPQESNERVLQSDLIETIYHDWIVNNSKLKKSLYHHLIAVKQGLSLVETVDKQESVEIIVAFICQHTRGKNERAVLAVIKLCCDNDNCFYQHQLRLRVKFREAIIEHYAERKEGR